MPPRTQTKSKPRVRKPKAKEDALPSGVLPSAPEMTDQAPEQTVSPVKSSLISDEASRHDQESSAGEKGAKPDRYFEAVGRRKTSTARGRLFTRAGDFTVNDKPYAEYFPTLGLQKDVEDALKKMKLWGKFRVSVRVNGGGMHSQAEAVRHVLSRCLVKFNPDFRKRLKRAGFLKRDPRMKERKKFGLKKARRAPQWQKR